LRDRFPSQLEWNPSVGLAHTDAATTQGYLKKRVVTVSELMMSLPPGTKTEEEK